MRGRPREPGDARGGPRGARARRLWESRAAGTVLERGLPRSPRGSVPACVCVCLCCVRGCPGTSCVWRGHGSTFGCASAIARGSVCVRTVRESTSVRWRRGRESLSVWGCELLPEGMKRVTVAACVSLLRGGCVRCGGSCVSRACRPVFPGLCLCFCGIRAGLLPTRGSRGLQVLEAFALGAGAE